MTDVSELFQRDPSNLTKNDIRAIIERFRSQRHQFNAGDMKAGSTKPLTKRQQVVKDLSEELDIKI